MSRGNQRSKDGCLTCRKKRKKCDEKKPECLRCAQSNSNCQWPAPVSYISLTETLSASISQLMERTSPTFPMNYAPADAYSHEVGQSQSTSTSSLLPLDISSMIDGIQARTEAGEPHASSFNRNQLSIRPLVPAFSYLPGAFATSDDRPNTVPHQRRDSSASRWTVAHNYGPTIDWPLLDTRIGDADDSDWDPEGILPIVKSSIDALNGLEEPGFQELCNLYSVFIPRLYYDYTKNFEHIIAMLRQRFNCTGSARHGMLSLALLFRSNYDRSNPPGVFHKQSKRMYQAAVGIHQVDLHRVDISPTVKLTGLTEILTYDYYSGNFPLYYDRLQQAASLVNMISGGNALDILALSGEQTLDIRIFAWCDILGSMAWSRPTLVRYKTESDLAQRDLARIGHDAGIEEVFGCPDALAVILARISSLRRPELSFIEILSQVSHIEQALHSWQPRVHPTKHPLLRIARLGVQEIWRHTAILYLYQTAYHFGSSHDVVRRSVKQIIQIASTIKPGGNPDCFMSVPYFVAGSFATSPKDRHFLRTRLLGCGNEHFLRDLAATLECLWRETDATGNHVSWSTKQPPDFIF